MKRVFFLFFRFLAQNVKIKLEYKADFIIMLLSGGIFQGLSFVFLSVLFSRIPVVQGWEMNELIFMMSAIFISEGVVSFAFEGVWQQAFLVNTGDLDRMLLRPVSPIMQIMCFTVGPHGIGNLIMGLALTAYALTHTTISWDIGRILFLPVFLVSGAAIRLGISFAANASAFWLRSFSNSFPLMVFQCADFAKYPSTFFHGAIQLLITTVIPYAFISYVPAVYLFHKAWWGIFAWGLPLVAAWTFLLSRFVFYRGLHRYDSPGN